MAESTATDSVPSKDDGCVLGPTERIVHHQQRVWRYLRMLGCDLDIADDLTQETFLKVLNKIGFRPINDAATASYLCRTAHNLMVSHYRRQCRVSTTDDPAVLEVLWERWTGKDLCEELAIEEFRSCFCTIAIRRQKALIMRYVYALSPLEVGQQLGISKQGAKNLMQRAKQEIRRGVETKLAQLDR